jgi:addiction module HigA family antidote
LSQRINNGQETEKTNARRDHARRNLLEEFLIPALISQNRLARAIGVPPARINDIIRGRRAITADIAARLSICFGTTPDLWLNLQARYDAKTASRQMVPALLKKIRPRALNVA